MDQLLGGAFTLLSDPNLEAISAYQMEHRMGGAAIGWATPSLTKMAT
jgi:hypothetical protein